MNQIDLIRAEIKRLKGQLIRGSCAAQTSFETSCKDEAYNEILSFLDTIEKSEKQNNHLEVVNDLTNEVPTRAVQLPDGRYVTEELARQMAHEGLDEVASRAGFDYVDDIVLLAEPNHRWNDHDVEQAHSDGFKAGAEWAFEQIKRSSSEEPPTP